VLGLGLPGHLAEPLHGRHVAADGVVAGAGVPARRVVEPVLDGGVPDHDAAVVLGQGRVRQLRDGRRGGGALGPQQDRVLGRPALDGEAVAAPLVRAAHVVLNVLQRLGALVHHQPDGVRHVVAVALVVPGGVDDVDLCLDLGVAVGGLADDDAWRKLLQLADEVHHVGPRHLVGARALLEVEVDAVAAVLLGPPGHLLRHLLRGRPGGQPVPGVGLQRVGVAADGEHDDGVGGHGAGGAAPAGGRQLLECGRHVHGVGVDEGEEEHVGGVLLPLEQLGVLPPLRVALVTVLVIVGQQHVQPQHLVRPLGPGAALEGGCEGGPGAGLLAGRVAAVVRAVHDDGVQHGQAAAAAGRV